MIMKRLFARLQNIETGGEGMAGGGEIDDSGVMDTADDGAEIVQIEASEPEGPQSMFEAIEQGLKPKASEGEEDKAAADRARDELGRFAKQDEKPAGEQKPEAEKPAEADEFAMPEGLSAKAQERFQTLVSRVKEREQALEAVTRDVEDFRAVINESRATPQDFSQALDYIRMVNTGDLQGALRVIDAQRQQIALALGQPLPGADPLQSFPDLRQRVDAYQMDEATAIELARTRQMQQRQAEMQRQQQQTMQSQQAMHTERANAVAQIDQLGAQWAKSDPDYAAKEEIILKQLPQIAANFPPAMWAQQVRILYDTVSAVPRPSPQRTAPPPLRSSGQTAGNRQPSNMLEALQAGLGYAGG